MGPWQGGLDITRLRARMLHRDSLTPGTGKVWGKSTSAGDVLCLVLSVFVKLMIVIGVSLAAK